MNCNLPICVLFNRDLFHHIFFQYLKESEDWIKDSVFNISQVCTSIKITSDTWKFFFRQCGYKLPPFNTNNNKLWYSYIQKENNIINRTNTCIECMNYMSNPHNLDSIEDSEEGNKVYYDNLGKYFKYSDGADFYLYFDIKSFNIENILNFIENDEMKENILISQAEIFNNRKVHEAGEDINGHSYELLLIKSIEKDNPKWDSKSSPLEKAILTKNLCYKCKIGYEDDMVFFINEMNVQKLIEILIRNGLHPYNSCKNMLLI